MDLHPKWRQLFFSDEACRRFVARKRPDLLELYDFYPRPVQRADLFRVVAIQALGGFYLDLDLHLYRPLDPLRRTTLVLTEERLISREVFVSRHCHEPADSRDLYLIGNYGFGAVAKHWFLEEVLNEMLHRAGNVNPSSCNDDDVLHSTGPDVFTAVYNRHRTRLSGECVLLRGRNGFPPPRPRLQREEKWFFQFGEYGVHLMTSVWHLK